MFILPLNFKTASLFRFFTNPIFFNNPLSFEPESSPAVKILIVFSKKNLYINKIYYKAYIFDIRYFFKYSEPAECDSLNNLKYWRNYNIIAPQQSSIAQFIIIRYYWYNLLIVKATIKISNHNHYVSLTHYKNYCH